MALAPGSRVGPYEVGGPLGAGGMGEVYRARDPRLQRDVALKVLPEMFAADPERLARFEREAQALAALKHPHIATIYGIEDRALVLELVEGETLEERLARGAVPVDEAIAIARQIASALDAAHEQGIVHRDLKPANIKLTPDGAVKVLDFGLAKLADPGASGISRAEMATGTPSMSPTMASPATVTGSNVILGTAAYMAPEQARGKSVDKRADIWAFGVILYEMLTGTRAFAGDSVTEVAGAVIHKDLDLGALPAATPAAARVALRQCLQKDPKKRIRDIGDVALLLDGTMTLPAVAPAQAIAPRSTTHVVAVAASAVAAVLAGGAVWLLARPAPAARYPVRLVVESPNQFSLTTVPVLDLSPDGRTIAFIVPSEKGPRLWVRPFESNTSRLVEGVDTLRLNPLTFWSADGRSLGFYQDGKLRRIAVAGGPVASLADVQNFNGGFWNDDNVIAYSDLPKGILRVSAAGGSPTPVTALDKDRGDDAHAFPSVLPDGRHFLYYRESSKPEVTGIYIGDIEAQPAQQERTRLLASSTQAVFSSPDGSNRGFLVFMREGALMAQPFDAASRTLSGEAVAIVDEPVMRNGGYGSFAASRNGTLAYLPAQSPRGVVTVISRAGVAQPLFGDMPIERVTNPRVSPDGEHLALMIAGDLWSYDLRGRPPIKLTFDGGHFTPLWTPDGSHIVYERGGNRGPSTVFSVPADGSGGTPEQVAPDGHFHPQGWTASGELVVARVGAGTADLFRVAPRKDATLQVVQATPASEGMAATVSPDGKWVAYAADTTGRNEIWVRPLPGPGAAVRVSPDGGFDPVWARNGRELFYFADAERLMSVAVELGAAFNFKAPVELFRRTILNTTQPPLYDVLPDGRFVTIIPAEAAQAPISVILNWDRVLAARPAAR